MPIGSAESDSRATSWHRADHLPRKR